MKKILGYIDGTDKNADSIIELAVDMQNRGVDEIVLTDFTLDEDKHEAILRTARELSHCIDIPFILGTAVKRFEDAKKAFYTGASAVLLRASDVSDSPKAMEETVDRFGKDKVFVCYKAEPEAGMYMINGDKVRYEFIPENDGNELTKLAAKALDDENENNNDGAAIEFGIGADIMGFKRAVSKSGVEVNTFTTDVTFDELKKGSDGLVPCIVQDYKSGEVLMMAYMDEAAYNKTVETGIMTYHSRSRNELWIKGATSGHYQYLRELSLDCDSDTLLAEVVQIGAACHTGSRSCFYKELVKHEYSSKDISQVLSSLYEVVVDRKVNPKEGSYTNYLFNKGIDKILKKCGEEATEMVIAAKNPDAEELKYEIADLLYHMTVLMVECGVDWTDVAGELANR